MILATCEFDEERCKDGIRGLENYRREWDDKQKVWKNNPLHDWASNPADAFRYFGVGQRVAELQTQFRHKMLSGEGQKKYNAHKPLEAAQRSYPQHKPFQRARGLG